MNTLQNLSDDLPCNLSKLQKQVISLAGIMQNATLINEFAFTGKIDQVAMKACLYSIFQVKSNDTISIYKNLAYLETGLKTIIDVYSKNNSSSLKEFYQKNSNTIRYTFSIILLENIVRKKPNMLDMIRQGVKRAHQQAKIYTIDHANVIANLASIYTDTLSTLKFRIHVTGEPNILNRTSNINLVRSLLLAGIRAAVLFRQFNGSRWKIFFFKEKMVNTAKDFLQIIEKEKQHQANVADKSNVA